MTIEENAEEQISNAELKLYNIADKNETTGYPFGKRLQRSNRNCK